VVLGSGFGGSGFGVDVCAPGTGESQRRTEVQRESRDSLYFADVMSGTWIENIGLEVHG
jgi:hypothetical protein